MSNTFREYVENGLSQLDAAISIEKVFSSSKETLSDPKNLEFIKVSNLGRASENFVKAMLFIYASIFVLPVAFLAIIKNIDIMPELKELEFELKNLVEDYTDKEKLKRKLSHYPVSKSHLHVVIKISAEVLKKLGAKDLAKTYEKISKILSSKDAISYNELKEVRLSISNTGFIKEIYFSLKNTDMEDRYKVDMSLSILDIGAQSLLDFLLYAKYLEIASTKGQYPASLSEEEEEKLSEIAEHQKEIMDVMTILWRAVKVLSENEEFLEMLKEIVESVKYFFP